MSSHAQPENFEKNDLSEYLTKPFCDEIPTGLRNTRRNLLLFSSILLIVSLVTYHQPNETIKFLGFEHTLLKPVITIPLWVVLFCIEIAWLYHLCYFYFAARSYWNENKVRATGTKITIPENTSSDNFLLNNHSTEASREELRLDDCEQERQATIFCWLNKVNKCTNQLITSMNQLESDLDQVKSNLPSPTKENTNVEQSLKETNHRLKSLSEVIYEAKSSAKQTEKLLAYGRLEKSFRNFDSCFRSMKSGQRIKLFFDLAAPIVLAYLTFSSILLTVYPLTHSLQVEEILFFIALLAFLPVVFLIFKFSKIVLKRCKTTALKICYTMGYKEKNKTS